MRSVIILEIEHSREIPALADLIAGRAYNIDGVDDANLVGFEPLKSRSAFSEHGFSAAELALGAQEVFRT